MQNLTKQPLPIAWVDKIFMRLHGRFGNTFADKFRIGELDENGKDIGVENAKIVWSEELAGITATRIAAALDCKYEFTPSADDFLKNCVVKAEINDHKALPRPEATPEVMQEGLQKIAQLTQAAMNKKNNYRTWIKPILDNPKAYPDISFRLAKEASALEAA